ncbi:hypothetical protein OIV83_005847 [Microbotryomycetes sp. JL201]|nr:hypothetical protein OIV83_005847 [Microbotryomycetes sp. JL201]
MLGHVHEKLTECVMRYARQGDLVRCPIGVYSLIERTCYFSDQLVKVNRRLHALEGDSTAGLLASGQDIVGQTEFAEYLASCTAAQKQADNRKTSIEKQLSQKAQALNTICDLFQQRRWHRSQPQLEVAGWTANELRLWILVFFHPLFPEDIKSQVRPKCPDLLPNESPQAWRQLHEFIKQIFPLVVDVRNRMDNVARQWPTVVARARDLTDEKCNALPTLEDFVEDSRHWWEPIQVLRPTCARFEFFMETSLEFIVGFRTEIWAQGRDLVVRLAAVEPGPPELGSPDFHLIFEPYHEALFSKARHAFFLKTDVNCDLMEFPDFLQDFDFGEEGILIQQLEDMWRHNFSRHHVVIYTAALQAAGLELESATIEDAEALPPGFVWHDRPTTVLYSYRMSFVELVDAYLSEHAADLGTTQSLDVPDIRFEDA